MTEIINLRQFRKSKERDEQDRAAAANRAKFGMSKAEKRAVKSDINQITRALDGAKLKSADDDTK